MTSLGTKVMSVFLYGSKHYRSFRRLIELCQSKKSSGKKDHVTQSNGLAKTVLQGTVPGGRKRGRQKRKCLDDIRDWTGLSLAESLRSAEDRDLWHVIVKRLAVVPQRPPHGVYGIGKAICAWFGNLNLKTGTTYRTL